MIFDNSIDVKTWSRSTGSMPNSPNSTGSWFPIWWRHKTSPRMKNNEGFSFHRRHKTTPNKKIGNRSKFIFTCSFPGTSWPDIKPWILLKLEMVVLTFHLEEAFALLGWMIICLMIACVYVWLYYSILISPATISVEVWSENVLPRDQSPGLREKGEGWKRTERAPKTILYFRRKVAFFYLVKIVSLHHLVGSHHLWAG